MALAAVAAVLVLASAACGGDDGGGADTGGEDAGATTTTAGAGDPDGPAAPTVDLRRLLVDEGDLAGTGFEAAVVARPFRAEEAARIQLCGEDLRAELGVEDGRQSRFSDGTVEVAHTVTLGGDASALVATFDEVVAGCAGPWTDPELPTGGGPVERELTGSWPVPDVGLPATGAVVRSTNDRGQTDTVVVVMVSGPVVSSLSVSGPVGSDFGIVDQAVVAAADRLGR